MQQNIEFERCIDFLVRMIDKYGEEVLRELEEENRIRKKKKRQFPEIQNVNQTVAFCEIIRLRYLLLLQAYKDHVYFYA